MEETPRTLGPYKLISELGSGAFGVVWLAEKQTAIATTRVALKLPHSRNIDLEAFKQEASIWIQASGHPNVLPLIDADIYGEQAIIVSEYAPDGSLLKWLKEHGGRAPSIEAACEMIDGVLAGLSHLHARRIIHRDLKPDNILLQGGTPRLTDFGISRLLLTGSLTMTVGGTPTYMAPEAFSFKRNERTDIWSVGVIFYQLLAGCLPYNQRDLDSLVDAIMQQDAPPLPAVVPETLRNIVMKALQRDPARRYATAKEMRDELREAKYKLWLGEQKTIIAPSARPAPIPEPLTPQPQPQLTKPQPQPIESQPQPSETQPQPLEPTLPAPHIPAKLDATLPVIRKKRKWRGWLVAVLAIAAFLIFAFVAGTLFIRALSPLFGINTSSQTSQSEGTKQASPPEADAAKQASTSATVQQADVRYALKQTLTGHSSGVWSVAFSPDSTTLASGSNDESIRFWDARTGESKQSYTGLGNGARSVAFSPDGKKLAAALYGTRVQLLNVATGQLEQSLKVNVFAVAFSPDSRTLASGGFDNTISLWDAQSGMLKQTLTGHTDFVYSVAFSRDGKTLASASRDKTIKLWDAETGALKRTLAGHTSYVFSVAFSPDGKTLASGSDDKTIKLWEAQTGMLKQTLNGHSSSVESVKYSPDGRTLASGSDDHTVKLWDAETGALQQTLTGHTDQVEAVAFSPDGKLLASGSMDRTVILWQLE